MNNQQFLALVKGADGKDGKDGMDGMAADVSDLRQTVGDLQTQVNDISILVQKLATSTTTPPSAKTHIVLVADREAKYWRYIDDDLDKTMQVYPAIDVVPPPTTFSVGQMPKLVVYKNGTPVSKAEGQREVEDYLKLLRDGRVTFD